MDHFSFITEPVVKKELTESRQFIVWLSRKYGEESDENLLLSIKKDIFIHIGSIIEAMLFYVARKLCATDKALKTMSYTKAVEIHKISESERIVYHTEKKIVLDPEKTDFHALIEALSHIE